MELRRSAESVDWAELAVVFERAPLGPREPGKLQRAFERSHRVCFAYEAERLVGAARLLSDGEYYAAVYDVVVLPEYQRRGIGAKMLAELMDGLAVGSTILVSVPGREPFYARQGFAPLKTAMARYREPERARDAGYIA
jgi:ribosomal protein S18 acetylase RimI-like enzyme